MSHSRIYRQRRVWGFLRNHPEGVSRRMIMERFGMTECAASNQLQRLLRRGCVRREGSTRWPTWYATDVEPQDRRGCNTASLVGIKKGHVQWVNGLMAAAVALGRDPSRVRGRTLKPVRYEPATELEKCWSLPISRRLETEDA